MSANSEHVPQQIVDKSHSVKHAASDLLAAALAGHGNDPWPAELDRRLRWNAVRGLPEQGDLFKLAAVYLELQIQLWPQVLEARVVPEPSTNAIISLARDFAVKFIERRVEPFNSPSIPQLWDCLGTSYIRYSSGQQNPRSLDDQLVIQLRRARQDRVFVPWNYVFGDAGVTGTTKARTGYNLAKELLALQGLGAVEVIYIDELARATRDGIETLLLGNQVQALGKRMIGVSDGFDSQEQSSRLKLHFFAMFNEQFIVQHRQKVLRGKEGAARRGTVNGRVPLGLKAVPAFDSEGAPLRVRQGMQANTFAIDEDTRPVLGLIAQRFVDERRSIHSICKEFNRLRVAGRTGWGSCNLRKILTNRIYLGIHVYNRCKHVRDPITGSIKIVQKPRSEWKVRRFRNIQIWSLKRWKQIQTRLEEVKHVQPQFRNRSGKSRNEVYPTALLSGLLFCGYCGAELKLFRSDTKRGYRQFWCRNGRLHRHGCQLVSSKSARVIEDSILNYVRGQILTAERIHEVVRRANDALAVEAAKPRVDVKPLHRAIADLKRKRDRLIDVIAGSVSPDLAAARNRIAQIEVEIRRAHIEIQQANAANASQTPPVDLDRTLSFLMDMRGLLNQDVSQVAPVLRQLLGKIWIREGGVGERRGADGKPVTRWTATVRAELIPLLAAVTTRRQDCPDSDSWVNLKQRIWTNLPEETILLDEPIYKRFAHEMAALVAEGLSIAEAGRKLGIEYESAILAWHFSQDGLNRRERQALKRR